MSEIVPNFLRPEHKAVYTRMVNRVNRLEEINKKYPSPYNLDKFQEAQKTLNKWKKKIIKNEYK